MRGDTATRTPGSLRITATMAAQLATATRQPQQQHQQQQQQQQQQ
jgi:hypothetical protein